MCKRVRLKYPSIKRNQQIIEDQKRRIENCKKDIANAKYRINHLPEEYKDWKCDLEKRLENLINYPEIERTNINSMVKSPIK